MYRKQKLEIDQTYHIFNRSIAGYVIFNNILEYEHMVKTAWFYQDANAPTKLSYWLRNNHRDTQFMPPPVPSKRLKPIKPRENLVEIIAYCLMPTHFHFVLTQAADNGISKFLGNIQNSYSRYFNTKHNRKGPLWEGRFKNVLVESEEQLLHLTRYIHLNPVTDNLVQSPADWTFSSYLEYIGKQCPQNEAICHKKPLPRISKADYRNFVMDQIAYQKELALIKHLTLE